MTETAASEDPTKRALEELARQRRLVDQSLTMQARLRDRDRVIGVGMVCAVLVMSLFGVAFAFAGANPNVSLLGLTATRATWLGALAIATVALTLIDLVVDRRGAAQRRADAVRVLGALKAEYRVPPAAGEEVATAARMSERYAQAMDSIPAVPERSFNRLKAWHLRKVEVSKALSEHPGLSLRRAKAVVRRRHKEVGK